MSLSSGQMGSSMDINIPMATKHGSGNPTEKMKVLMGTSSLYIYTHTYVYMRNCSLPCLMTRGYVQRLTKPNLDLYFSIKSYNLFSLLLKLPQLIKIGMDWQLFFFVVRYICVLNCGN